MKANWMKYSAAALMVVAMAGCIGPGVNGPDDAALIGSMISDMTTALLAQDIDKVMMVYAEDMEWDQGGKAEYEEFLAGAKEGGFLDDMEVSTEDMEIIVDGDKATAEPMEAEGQFGVLTFEFELEKRDGKWMVVKQTQY